MNGSAAGPLRVVVLGLSLSSSWGNGHATTFRALLRAFSARGHDVLFLERDVPWYAANRDLPEPGFCRFALYRDLEELAARWGRAIADADAVILGSYVPEGIAVGNLVQRVARGVTAFYDIDTPVTLARIEEGRCDYLAPGQIAGFDLHFSFTGGPTLDILRHRYGARRPRVLFCSVDPAAYVPLDVPKRWALGYLGTYSADRQPPLDRLLLEVARRVPDLRFVVAGPQYPETIDWPANVERIEHLPPVAHPAFYAACRYTLNITRADMVRLGHSPSVRLFEAAACGVPVISDTWEGLESLFKPEREILLAEDTETVLAALRGDPDGSRARHIGAAARERVLAAHTASHRAAELERHLRDVMRELQGADAPRAEAVAQ
ncbi:MAG: glycosyltransferase [Acetobacteraceae bacterium]|nr:glycosyltransferase [Acetobacteraceae bacterium]